MNNVGRIAQILIFIVKDDCRYWFLWYVFQLYWSPSKIYDYRLTGLSRSTFLLIAQSVLRIAQWARACTTRRARTNVCICLCTPERVKCAGTQDIGTIALASWHPAVIFQPMQHGYSLKMYQRLFRYCVNIAAKFLNFKSILTYSNASCVQIRIGIGIYMGNWCRVITGDTIIYIVVFWRLIRVKNSSTKMSKLWL